MGNGWWKCGLGIGIGIVVGAVGATLLSRNPGAVKKGLSSVLSHAMEVKDKAATALETARENMEDLAAEARHDLEARKQNAEKTEA